MGTQISQGLAGLGSKLVLHSRDLSHTRALASRLAQSGVKVVTVAAELSDQRQVEAMLDEVQAKAGPIDIIYNNAVIQLPKQSGRWNTPVADLQHSFAVNVIRLGRICDRLVPPMLARRWGRVVNLTSGIRDQPKQSAYALSKAAVDKFVRDFTLHLAGSGVQMNLLDPGWLRTDLGGPNAPGDPASVLPGALVPVLVDDGISGRFFQAQDYAGMTIEAALTRAVTA